MKGSFINLLYSNSQTTPKKGDWATICLYTDRQVAKVHDISKDGKRVIIQHCNTKGDGTDLPMGHQDWKHEPRDHFETIVYRNKSWRTESKSIEFDDKWYKQYEMSGERFKDYTNGLDLWDEHGDIKLIDGVTKLKTTYNKIDIVFGVCDYHYDWTF
jgi:hypothetical protein